MFPRQSPGGKHYQSPATDHSKRVALIAWGIAVLALLLAAWLVWSALGRAGMGRRVASQPVSLGGDSGGALAKLPPVTVIPTPEAITRKSTLFTIIPKRPSLDARDYTVAEGDSIFEIAQKFDLKPETILWANYDVLNDNPDLVYAGMKLKIPPTDGVYYQWQAGDDLQAVANRFDASLEAILAWAGNQLDLTNPQVEAGKWLMVPGGHREFRQWVIPVIPRGRAGVSRALYGGGACEGSYEGAYGTGAFIWPAANHTLSGNDYWSGHLAIDIAAGEGAQIFAADSGVVVFAGWASGGYGNTVMIDHGNGYQTLYAHLSQISTQCGRSVAKGGVIGSSGTTGMSTGPHLHFEVRYQGGFVSPWYALPAP